MVRANPIDELLTQFMTKIQNEPQLERHIQLELGKALRSVYSSAISSDEGYCMTLKIPENSILSLGPKMGFEITQIQAAFQSVWEFPKDAYMYSNPYYHILIFLILYGIRTGNEVFQKDSLSLVLAKIWNGRRLHFIKFCRADIMKYVIANLSGKYIARKYDNPMAMLMQHFTPTLLKKYGEPIREDSLVTKRLFNQCWGRIQQIFISSKIPNLKTGENKGRSGLAAVYYDSAAQGLSISKPVGNIADAGDEGMASTDYYSSHEFDDLINGIVNFIVMNVNPSYDPGFIQFVVRATTVNQQATEMILKGLHSNKYTDWIRDILELMFKQMQVTNKTQICGKEFLTEVIKKKFIASKHSPNITQLKKIIDVLLEQIFEDHVKYVKYSAYSNPRQGHIRKVLFYGFAYNIQKFICHTNGG